MRVLPYNRFTINSRFLPKEINKILGNMTLRKEDVIDISIYQTEKPFVGVLHNDGFQIVPSGVMWSFRPVNYGEYVEQENGTSITVKQSVSICGKLILICWILMSIPAFIIGTTFGVMGAFFLALVVLILPCILMKNIISEMKKIQFTLMCVLGQ